MKKYKLIIDSLNDRVFINLYDDTLNKWYGEWIYENFEINGKWASDFKKVELNESELINWGVDFEETE